MTMLRKITSLCLCLVLCSTLIACGGPDNTTLTRNTNSPTIATPPTQIRDGQYPVQQATYNDADGKYSLFLLNTPPGTPATFRTTNLQMARLTDEEIKVGQKSYLQVEHGQPSLHLTEDFKIEYIHAVTETRNNPETGQPETVVVRQERGGFWAPFAGAVAGQLVGSLLFRPQYYVPPVYQPGTSVLTGFGGYGSSYTEAVNRYQTRYQAPPPAVKNRQITNLRTTGRIRTSSSSQPTTGTRTSLPSTSNRPTGSGYGSSTLRSSNRYNSGYVRRRSSGSFGSGGRSAPIRRSTGGSFGSRRR
jgi:hypothetical protein